MNSTFQPYVHDRLIDKTTNKGYYVIVPNTYTLPVPIACPVCDGVMRTYDDECAWHKFQCCDLCSMCWAAANREKWLSGWRPEQCDIDAAVKNRLPFVVSIEGK